MVADRSFRIALLISVACHGALFYGGLDFRSLILKDRIMPPQLTYFKIKGTPRPLKRPSPASTEKIIAQKEQLLRDEPIIKREKIASREKKSISFSEPKPAQQEKISVPSFPSLANQGPAYLDYYRTIREKIRYAISYPNEPLEGEVYICFDILSNGQLKEIRILKERSSNNRRLTEAAALGIKKACPFPSFPKGLDQSQISFNLLISFELGK